jgi:hypothetical protein
MGLPHLKSEPNKETLSDKNYFWEQAKYEARHTSTNTHVDEFHRKTDLAKRIGGAGKSPTSIPRKSKEDSGPNDDDMDELMGFEGDGDDDSDDDDEEEEEKDNIDNSEEVSDDSDDDDNTGKQNYFYSTFI